MKSTKQERSTGKRMFCSAMLVLALAATGCQVNVGGRTLPSAYSLGDDIQYFPAGPEFQYEREAAAQLQGKIRAEENEARK